MRHGKRCPEASAHFWCLPIAVSSGLLGTTRSGFEMRETRQTLHKSSGLRLADLFADTTTQVDGRAAVPIVDDPTPQHQEHPRHEALPSDPVKVHPATPRSSARGGAKRFPPGVTRLLHPAVDRNTAAKVLGSASAEDLALSGEVVLFRNGRVDRTPVTLGPAALWRWRDLWAIRRIGTYRDAPNRIGMYVVEQDGHRRMLESESLLEKAHLCDLQFNGGVTWMITQPFALRWPVEDRCMWRVPDILAYDESGPFVADVKPEHARTELTDLMFDLTRRTLARVGVGYQVLGDMSRQRQLNLRALASQRWLAEDLGPALRQARSARRSSMGGVVDSAGSGPSGRAVGLHLLTRELGVDLDHRITAGSPVEWSS